jgi:hypothetical protein
MIGKGVVIDSGGAPFAIPRNNDKIGKKKAKINMPKTS